MNTYEQIVKELARMGPAGQAVVDALHTVSCIACDSAPSTDNHPTHVMQSYARPWRR
jgi:hypothetical protein